MVDLGGEPLLYNLRPTAAQVRSALLVAILTLVAFLVTLPFGHLRLARIDSFVPAVDTALFLGDGITAALLLTQASVLRSKALLALGTGYFFTSLMIIPHGLTFPWAFSPTGLLGAGLNTSPWLYFIWHSGLPASVIVYASLRHSPSWSNTASLFPRKAIAICIIFATILAGALALLAVVGESLLPQMMSDPINANPEKIRYLAYPVMLITVVAMAMTWRERSSTLDLWLLLILWTWLLDILSSTLTPFRFSFGWYSGRTAGLLSGLFVLLALLGETSKLYAQAVLHIKARLWEREDRLMIRDVIVASITHELRQPLAAILLNAQTGQRRFPKPDRFILSILDEIVCDTFRANDIIESTRSIFGKSNAKEIPSNISKLARDTLVMITSDLRTLGVSLDLRLDDSLPPIAVNRLQMQQVLLNLFMNAAEAMSTVADRPRVLTIRSGSGDDGVVIGVEDTGPGIAAADQGRIFDAFFTTKKNGMGLGLSICRSVIAAHGGRLHTAAREPTGAIFEIHLPYGGSAEMDALDF